MSDVVLLGKVALSIFGVAVIVALLRRRPFDSLSDRDFGRASLAALAVTRLPIYALLFVVLGLEGQSDVITYYDLGKHVLASEVPYRDFFNGYAPLFPYAASLPVRLWDSNRSIILVSVLFELAAFPFWLAAARRFFDERTARTAAVFYVFNPLTLVHIPIAGQNNTWLFFTLGVSLYLLSQRRYASSGLSVGAGVVLVKFLSLLHVPAIGLAIPGFPRRFRWAAALVAPIVLVYGALQAKGISVAASMKYHSADASSGNLPYLFTVLGLDPHAPAVNRFYNLAGVALLGGLCLVVLARFRTLTERQAIHMMTLLSFTLALVSRKSYPAYLTMAFFANCLTVAAARLDRRALGAFLAFSVVAALESSLWFRWAKQHQLDILWRGSLPDDLTWPKVIVFLAFEVALLGFYAHGAVSAWRALHAEAGAPRPLDGG
jgi:hypothetical protein